MVGEAVESGQEAFLVFDPLADTSLVMRFHEMLRDAEYELMFRGTPLDHLNAQSPYAYRLSSTSCPFWEFLMASETPWGFIAIGNTSFSLACAHWRSLLLVNEDGRRKHLRFYDGEVMARLLNAMPDADMALFMGPHSILLAFGRSADENTASWKLRHNPRLERAQMEGFPDDYILRQAPWWGFGTECRSAFADKEFGIAVYSVTQYLFEHHPALAGRCHAQEPGLENFVTRHMHRAMRSGLSGQETIRDYLCCCLTHGEDFPRGTALDGAMAPGVPESAYAVQLSQIARKL